jgi:hypothetical protein
MELWLVIVTGEAVLAIVTASSEVTDEFSHKDGGPHEHYFFNMALAIVITVLLLAIYETARPVRKTDADKFAIDSLSPLNVFVFNLTHLFSTFGMLLVSVAMKLVMYNMGHDERFSRYHAGLLCCGITVYLTGLNVAKYANVWTAPQLMPGARYIYRVLHTIISFLFFPLMFLVGHKTCHVEADSHGATSTSSTEHEESQCFVQEGISPQELMAIIFVMLVIVWLLEQLLAPTPAEHKLHAEKHSTSRAAEDRLTNSKNPRHGQSPRPSRWRGVVKKKVSVVPKQNSAAAKSTSNADNSKHAIVRSTRC